MRGAAGEGLLPRLRVPCLLHLPERRVPARPQLRGTTPEALGSGEGDTGAQAVTRKGLPSPKAWLWSVVS